MAFDQDRADRICEEMARGRSLRAICREDGMPNESAVRKWALADVAGFGAQYTRARELQAHTLFDEILEISDDSSGDVVKSEHGDKANPESVGRAKLRVDSRKWYISKVLPKLYGDKVELSGALEHKHRAADMTDDELVDIAKGKGRRAES